MPNISPIVPGQPIAPGITGANSGFPQYGVEGNAGSQTIVVAQNEAQKVADEQKGALEWFSTRQDAQNFINSQTGFGSGNVPGLTGLSAIGDFFSRLTNGNTWVRVAEFAVAGVLIFAGVNHLMGNPAGRAVRSAGKAAATGAILA